MPLFEETNPKTQTNQPEPKSTDQPNSDKSPEKKSSMMTVIGQLLPLAPFVFEQFTGQKIPQMTGTMADIQLTLTQIQTNLQVIANNQQQLAQRIINLETHAAQQLTNLNQQFQSFRLTHTKERKEIEYNSNKITNEEY